MLLVVNIISILITKKEKKEKKKRQIINKHTCKNKKTPKFTWFDKPTSANKNKVKVQLFIKQGDNISGTKTLFTKCTTLTPNFTTYLRAFSSAL